MFKKALSIKEGYIPSFFMPVVFALLLLLSISIHNYLIWFSALFLLIVLITINLKEKIYLNQLSIIFLLFISLLIFNINFITPVKNAESIYLALLFLFGYLFSLNIDNNQLKHFTYIVVAFVCVLALWGVFQYCFGLGYLIDVGRRANAIFYTPNTFAATINFVLLPLLILYLHDKLPDKVFYLLLILFSGLLVSQSRGAWVAFIISLVFILFLFKIFNICIQKERIKKIIIGFMLLFFTFSILNTINIQDKNIDVEINNVVRSESIVSTMSHRVMLFDIAWQEIKKMHIFGSGLHTYQYFQLKNQKLPYVGNTTRYTHNDYLQLWMETGILGLVFFILIYLYILYKFIKFKYLNKNNYILFAVVLSSLTSFYVHALVDFLFYVPILLFMYSVSLGLISKIENENSDNLIININIKYLKLIFVFVTTLVITKPALAQVYYNKAIKESSILNIEKAFVYFSYARLFYPYEPKYYWHEGALLMNAVKVNSHPESAERADLLFTKGMSISPYDSRNRLARAELHRDYASLVKNSKSLDTIVNWNEQVLYWYPNDPVVQLEYLKSLIASENIKLAKMKLNEFLLTNPDNEGLQEIGFQLDNK